MVQLLVALGVAVLAAVVPTAVYVSILWWLDRYEKEPVWLFSLAFFWGAIPGVIAALVLEVILHLPLAGTGEGATRMVEGAALAPLVEEAAKGAALVGILLFHRAEFDDVLDGVIYGAVIGSGFAMTENALYFLAELLQGDLGGFGLVWLLRAVVFGLNHALFGAIFGAGLGAARLARAGWQRWCVPVLAFALAVLLHASHNLFTSLAATTCWLGLFSLAGDWGGLAVILVVIILSWRQERRWLSVQLGPEVESGVLTAEEYAVLPSSWRRLGSYWEALSRAGWAAAQARRRRAGWAIELAFKKQQLQAAGSTTGEAATIEMLRARLRGA